MATLGKIRRMYFRDGLSLSEISRRTSLSRNTIRSWLRKPQGSEPRYQRTRRPGKLTAFEAMLVAALETDARRPAPQARQAQCPGPSLSAQPSLPRIFNELENFCGRVGHYI